MKKKFLREVGAADTVRVARSRATMSGPGAFEPSPAEQYIPAKIKETAWTKGSALPSKPSPGEDELWFIQAPGDVSVKDLRGLRFKLMGEGSGAELATFKAGGKKYRLVEEDKETASHMFVLPPASGKTEFAPAVHVTRRVTLMRRAKGAGEPEDGGEAKTPGEKKEKKKKKKKEFSEKKEKSAKKAKR